MIVQIPDAFFQITTAPNCAITKPVASESQKISLHISKGKKSLFWHPRCSAFDHCHHFLPYSSDRCPYSFQLGSATQFRSKFGMLHRSFDHIYWQFNSTFYLFCIIKIFLIFVHFSFLSFFSNSISFHSIVQVKMF